MDETTPILTGNAINSDHGSGSGVGSGAGGGGAVVHPNRPHVNGYIALLLLGSLIEMWSASTFCATSTSCDGAAGWALSAGVISFGLCLVIVFAQMCGHKVLPHTRLSLFFVVLWSAGVSVATFEHPFKAACSATGSTAASSQANGYFSCWICFLAALQYFKECSPQIKSHVAQGNRNIISYLTIASALVFVQATLDGWTDGWSDVVIWGLTCALTSLLLCGVLWGGFLEDPTYLHAFLALLWFFGVSTLTFSFNTKVGNGLGIYATAGNGFFGTWAAFFLSFVLAYGSCIGGKKEVDTEDVNMYIALILVTSFYEMWAASEICDLGTQVCKGEVAWAVSVGVMSLATCICIAVLQRTGYDNMEQVHPVAAILLFLLWTNCVGVATFKEPFRSACHAQNPNDQAPSSGFFACWIALLSSIRYMQLTVQSMKTFELPMELPHKAILGASLVVVIQSIFDGPFDAYAYACAVGLISFFFAMVLLLEVGKKWAKFIYFFLTGLWFCAVAIFTFQYTDKKELGVFSSAGNGFFATWIAFVSSFLLLFTECSVLESTT